MRRFSAEPPGQDTRPDGLLHPAVTDPVGFWNSHTLLIAQIGINGILASSMFIVLYSGQHSLAAPGFMAIAASPAVLMDLYWHTPLALNILAGLLLAGIVGVRGGLPGLRFRGVFFRLAPPGFLHRRL